MGGSVIISNSETTGEVPLEPAAVTTIKTEEMPTENQIQQQPDIKPSSEEISQVSVAYSETTVKMHGIF
jgi:hypothetical protein